jgi:hypothetical protein
VTQPDAEAHDTEAHEAERRKKRHRVSWPCSRFVSHFVSSIRAPYAVNGYEAIKLDRQSTPPRDGAQDSEIIQIGPLSARSSSQTSHIAASCIAYTLPLGAGCHYCLARKADIEHVLATGQDGQFTNWIQSHIGRTCSIMVFRCNLDIFYICLVVHDTVPWGKCLQMPVNGKT